MRLPVTEANPIPEDEFHLSVGVDRSHCTGRLPTKIKNIQENGVTLSMLDILTHGSIFYNAELIETRRGESTDDARMRMAWQELENWKPHVVTNSSGNSRMVIKPSPDSEASKPIAKLLGEAVSLYIASEVTEIDYKLWVPRTFQKGIRHDIDAHGPQGRIIVEARGRYNGNNIPNAVKGIHDKFNPYFDEIDKNRAFSRAIGFVYCLRSEAEDENVPFKNDVIVVDPEGPGSPSETEQWRSMLRHYSAFFSQQSKDFVAETLYWLSSVPDEMLVAFVRRQVRILPPPVPRIPGGSLWGRTTFSVQDHPFIGTVWSHAPALWGGILEERTRGMFWGVSTKVCSLLACCALDDLIELEVSRASWTDRGYRYAIAPDGCLAVFGHTIDHLLNHE